MNRIISKIFNLFRKFNDGIPIRLEVRYYLKKITINRIRLSIKIFDSMKRYSDGQSLEQIGQTNSITRERARQHLLKGCRVGQGLGKKYEK